MLSMELLQAAIMPLAQVSEFLIQMLVKLQVLLLAMQLRLVWLLAQDRAQAEPQQISLQGSTL
jgi:hypothetical protein